MDSPADAPLPVRTVTAEPPGFGSLLAEAARFPALVLRHRDLLASFVRRDVQARFHASVLGRLWPVLQPDLLLGLYYLVFVSILKLKYDAAGLSGPGVPEGTVPLWLFLGVLLWSAFAATVGRGTGAIVDHGNLVKTSAFPSQLLPFSIALAEGVVFLLGFLVFAVASYALGVGLPVKALLLPVLLVGLLAFALGLSLFTAAANVFVRDTANLVSVFLLFWMFLSPIFWPAESLARGLPPALGATLRLNPMYHVLEAARDLCGLPPRPGIPLLPIAVVLGSGVLSLELGYAYFLGARRRFADEI